MQSDLIGNEILDYCYAQVWIIFHLSVDFSHLTLLIIESINDFYAYFSYYGTRLFVRISLVIGEMVNYESLADCFLEGLFI